MKTAFLFPGQGSQYTGMARNLMEIFPIVRSLFEEADDVLDFPLSRLILQGAEEDLRKTENTQPAIFIVSLAYAKVLAEKGLHPDWAAGHSLGEYSALAALGALPVAEACRLVRARGYFMQRAVPQGVGAMAALLGLEATGAKRFLEQLGDNQAEVVNVAAYNSPSQMVLAGHAAAIERACDLARAQGARKATVLKVSAPFHCSLMKPAEEELTPLLNEVDWQPPTKPYVANATAEVNRDAGQMVSLLRRQMCQPVLWVQTMACLYAQGVRRFIEVGPGKVLTGLARQWLKTLPVDERDALRIESTDSESGLAAGF